VYMYVWWLDHLEMTFSQKTVGTFYFSNAINVI